MKKIILATVAVFMISLFTLSACFPSEVPAVETEMPALDKHSYARTHPPGGYP